VCEKALSMIEIQTEGPAYSRNLLTAKSA